MAKVPMKRIEIIALLTDGKSVIERLQRRGAVDLWQSDVPEDSDMERLQTSSSVQIFDKHAAAVRQALQWVDQAVPEKSSLLDSFSPRTELTSQEFADKADRVEDSIRAAGQLAALDRKMTELRAAAKSRRQTADMLEPWRPLPVPLRFEGTAHTTALIGTLPGQWDRETLLSILEPDPDTPIAAEASIIYASPEQSGIFVLCHKQAEAVCAQALRERGFALPAQSTDKPPAQAIDEQREAIRQAEEECNSLNVELREYASLREQWKFTLDYLAMKADKYKALESIAATPRTMIIQGYVPAPRADALAEELRKKYTISVTLEDPAEEEDVPVAFRNSLPAAALEDITESYSMPSKGDVDPNGVMAVFYYLLFGMMLSDAGYGLLMTIACWWILKFKKPEGNTRRNMEKFMLCGVSTVFWGALFGSWFGNIVSVVSLNFFGREVVLAPLWFDPVANPIKLLIFSLVVGFVHIVYALGVKFYVMWKNGDRWGAVFDVGFWWVVFAGLLCIVGNMTLKTPWPLTSIGTGIAIAGAVGLVLTQGRSSPTIAGKIIGGIGSLYSISGYFSDILSYCRLMALGLVTGIIGNVVNTIGSMGGGGVLGAILLVVVFLFGHGINMSINALGAYVHCNRLQYVEFFSKFYEGGGKLFTPLTVNTRYFKFKEDNTHV